MHFGFTPLYGMVVRFFNAVDRMRVGGYAGHNWVGANSLFFWRHHISQIFREPYTGVVTSGIRSNN